MASPNPTRPPSSQPPKQPSAQQPTLQELQYVHQLYQSQYQLLNQEMNNKLEGLRQIAEAQKALENANEFKDKNTLIHVGAAVYMHGKLENLEKILVAVGSGYLIEKDIDAAKLHISKLLDKESKALDKMAKSKRELESAMIEISYRIEELSR